MQYGRGNQTPDPDHLVPRLERSIANTAEGPRIFIADAHYRSEETSSDYEIWGVNPHISTGRQQHGWPPRPARGPIPKDLDAKGRMARILRMQEGREIYAKRKSIVGPVFMQTKEARGLRHFQLSNLAKVNSESTT